MPSLADLLVLTLATCQILDTWLTGAIFDRTRKDVSLSSFAFLRDLFACRFCLSHWVAMALSMGYLVHLQVRELAIQIVATPEFVTYGLLILIATILLLIARSLSVSVRMIPFYVLSLIWAGGIVVSGHLMAFNMPMCGFATITLMASACYWFAWSMAAVRGGLLVHDLYRKLRPDIAELEDAMMMEEDLSMAGLPEESESEENLEKN